MGRKYTAAQFLKAIPGTGGVISAIADRVGCDWYTAKRYIEEYATVKQAWQAEREKITDKARHNIIGAIDKKDLQMSKWWLQVMDDEFRPAQKVDVTSKGKEIATAVSGMGTLVALYEALTAGRVAPGDAEGNGRTVATPPGTAE